jgi:hypothetical protein
MRASYVRWLGAFRYSGYSLLESLQYEYNVAKERAVEKILNCSKIYRCKVGLLIHPKSIIKDFNGDCWSLYNNQDFLYKTRNPQMVSCYHKESWTSETPLITGVVVKGVRGQGFFNLKKKTQDTIIEFSNKYSLPIYSLVGNQLKEVKI